jgi:hypothetical protein
MEAKGAFWRQFRSHWLAAMSGGFSVPFSALAIFTGDKYQRAVFGMLALAAFLFATFSVWRGRNALKIRIGDAPEFEEVIPRADYVVRTLLACIENVDKFSFISNCKFSMAIKEVDYPLLSPFTLNPTERRFVQIATCDENGIDEFIHIRIPVGGYVSSASLVKLPLTGGFVTLKATCAEAKAVQQVCRLFVDNAGRLRIEKA